MFKATFLLIAFFSAVAISKAQNLTGTWEGSSGDEYWRMVLMQVGDSCYGYSYDAGPGFCKADFVAAYNQKENKFYGQATRFISSSFDHSLVAASLQYEEDEGDEYLTGTVGPKSLALKILSLGKGYTGKLRKISKEVDSTEFMAATARRLKKNSPQRVKTETLAMGSFISSSAPAPDEVTATKEIALPKETAPPKETLVVNETAPVQEMPADKESIPPQPITLPTDSILEVKQSRVTNIVKTITTTVDSVKIILYDDGEVDGDIVTVFDNGKIVANKLLLTKEPWSMVLPLPEAGLKHTIELVAENEGSIPPNTAYMLVIAGEIRTELKTSSDTKTNGAVIILKSN
jgi:hypothetical protein